MYDIYSPYDDEDEERAAAAALSGSTGPGIGSDPTEPDEQAAIRALAKEGQPPAEPHASRVVSQGATPNTPVQPDDDSGPGLNGWAIAADLVFNRGRGLGSIIGMAEQQKRDHLKARAMAGNRSQDLANKDRAHALESRRLDYLEGIEARKGQPQPETPEQKLARERFEAEKAERAIDNARADELLKLQRDKASADPEMTPYQQYSVERNKVLDKQRDEDRDDARQNKKSKDDATLAEHYTAKTEKARAAASSIKELDAIIEKYQGKNVPGFGAVESVTPDWVRGLKRGYHELRNDKAGLQADDDEVQRDKDAQTVSDALTNLSQSVLRKETGAVAAPREEDLTKIRTGSGKGRTEEQALEALRLMREMVYGDLRAYSSGREDIARNVIELNKLDADKIFGPRAQAAAAAATVEQPSAAVPPKRVADPMADDFSDFNPGENSLSVIEDDDVLKGLGITRKGRRTR